MREEDRYSVFVKSKNVVFVNLLEEELDILENILMGLSEPYSVYGLIDIVDVNKENDKNGDWYEKIYC